MSDRLTLTLPDEHWREVGFALDAHIKRWTKKVETEKTPAFQPIARAILRSVTEARDQFNKALSEAHGRMG